jgi:hypothetical protein
VQDPVINVTEPDDGMNVTVSSCFQANVTRSRRRAAVFVLTFLNSSTAYQGSDFNVDVPYFVIPVGFSGLFMECVNISITGDDNAEEDEVFEYSVTPMSSRDTVGISALRVNIFDNDGNYLFTHTIFVTSIKWQ